MVWLSWNSIQQNNAIGLDIIQMINFAIDEVEKNYKGLVIGNQGKNFCVGANLAMMLMEAQDDNIYELEMVIRQFQNAMMKIKYSAKPVVAAPFAMTLGGGAEVCLPAAISKHLQKRIWVLLKSVLVYFLAAVEKRALYETFRRSAKRVPFDFKQLPTKCLKRLRLRRYPLQVQKHAKIIS